MIHAELILEDRLNSANISKSGKYLFTSRSSKCMLYDFQNKKKILDIPIKYVRHSFFSVSEKFLIVRCPATFAVIDVASGKLVGKISAGTADATPSVLVQDDLLYLYSNCRTHKKTLYKYHVVSGERTVLYQDIDTSASLFSDGKTVYLFFNTGGTVVIDKASGHFQEYPCRIDGAAGIRSIAYSQELAKVLYVKKEDELTGIYAFDIVSGKSEFLRRVPSARNDIFIVNAYRHYLYIGRYFTSQLIDLTSENDFTEIDAFPIGTFFACDNPNYFSIFNGEYVSLYFMDK